MTPYELELLRAVAEALRALLVYMENPVILCGAPHMPEASRLREELDEATEPLEQLYCLGKWR